MKNCYFLDGYTLNPGDLSGRKLKIWGAFTVLTEPSKGDIIIEV